MKKRIVPVILLLCLAAGWGFASEDLEIFTYLYDAAQSPTDQLGILESVMEMKIAGAGGLYARALSKVVQQYPSLRGNTERENAEFLASLLAEALGNEKQVAAASDLWRAVNTFSNPLVKSDAMIALGKMRATAFLPQIAQTLSDMNNRPMSDRLAGERIAYGAIISLEKFQDPLGYLPVFFASKAWYTDRVKNQAAQSLPFIMKDPTDKMIEVIRGTAYPPATKLVALRNIEQQPNVSNQSKSAVALAALTVGLITQSNTSSVQRDLNTLRKESLAMITRYGSSDPAVYEQLAKCYNQGTDYQEKVDALNTLATLGTPEAAQRLNTFLMDLNTKQSSRTATNEDNNLVRAVIPAIGVVAHASSKPFLNAVDGAGWPAAVGTLAKDALAKIK